MGRAKAEDRARGYDLLISCARRETSSDAAAEVLRMCGRLGNEQDPVRYGAIRALATIPPSRFDDDHLDDLDVLVNAVLDARDTSSATVCQLGYIVLDRLTHAAGEPTSPRFVFALSTLDRILGASGSLPFGWLNRRLRGAALTLIDTLMPRIEREASVERYSLVISVAEALGKLAWGHAGLQHVLERATRQPMTRPSEGRSACGSVTRGRAVNGSPGSWPMTAPPLLCPSSSPSSSDPDRTS